MSHNHNTSLLDGRHAGGDTHGSDGYQLQESNRGSSRRTCGACGIFAIILAVATGFVVYHLTRSANNNDNHGMKAAVKARAVTQGGNIGWFTPASYIGDSVNITTYPSFIADTTRNITGGNAIFSNHSFDHWGSFGGTDQHRADDVHELFTRDDVHLIIANRGGWGCDRILDLLNYDLIAAHPKPLIGYSDLTALTNAIHVKTGLVTFHGPMGVDSWSSGMNSRYITDMIMNGMSGITYTNMSPYVITTITSGRATGKLYGGNLSVFISLIGSPYMPDLTGAILFLEEVTETPNRIDRMMAQLALGGYLKQIAGFVFGQCTSCGPDDSRKTFLWYETLEQYIKPLGVPAYRGAMFGHHVDQQFALPLGVTVTIDATLGSLTVVEAAVIV